MKELMSKCEMVFPKEDMVRFSVFEDGNLCVDVHGMSCIEAQRFIKNVIAMMRGEFSVYVIHGYNRGVAIKQMLRRVRLSARDYNVSAIVWNPGMTKLESVAATA